MTTAHDNCDASCGNCNLFPTPPVSADVERIAAELRAQPDNPNTAAIGKINGYAKSRTGAGFEAAVRDVLAALDLVLAERRDGAR